jgi:DNA-binding NarL/FixJ family response regulator
MNSPDRRTAIVVDQHPLWLETVEQVVRRAGIDVLHKVDCASTAADLIAERHPDLLVTGLKMKDGDIDGFELIRRAHELNASIKVIVLSMFEDGEHIDGAFAAGAHAYVLKTAHPDDLVSAVRQAFHHSIYLAGARVSEAAPITAAVDESAGLTRRELEILTLVAEGHSNAQLARMLWVTEQTVKFHLSNIYRKLDVANRTEASRWAQLRGLLDASASTPVMSAAG